MSRPVIELDLVLAGSASTGAYSAGALDFILEALACLNAARQDDPESFPGPTIRLKPQGATPAGRINAALAEHISLQEAHRSLYATWVNGLDLRDALPAKTDTPSSLRKLKLFAPDSLGRFVPAMAVCATDCSPAPARQFAILIDPMRDALPQDTRPVSRDAASLFLGDAEQEPIAPVEDRDLEYRILPMRSHRSGVSSLPALSSTIFEGFGGYLDARFREHDFQLGRRNAQRLLARHLTLSSHDPLMEGWSETLDYQYGVWPIGVAPVGMAPRRPLIPLTGSAAQPCPLPAWPQLERRALRKLEPLVAARIELIAHETAKRFLGDSLWTPIARMVISGRKRKAARETRQAFEHMLARTSQLAPACQRGLKGWFSRRAKPA